jgi:hypothetical protein
MRWLVTFLAACGGSDPIAPDAPSGPVEPRELADDDRAYELAPDCAALPAWPELRGISRVAAVSPREAWIVSTNELFHLRPDGTIDREPLPDVSDVRRCADATWAVGGDGLVARLRDGGDWERFDLPAAPPFQIEDAGAGCDGDLWIGLGYFVHVHDGSSWRSIATEPTFFDPMDPGAGQLEHEAVTVRGAGRYRIAASGYGETMAYFPDRDVFDVVAGTDDAISDAIAFRDGTGATLYNGHALAFDRDEEHNDGDSILDGRRASRRSDADIWIARDDEIAHYDGTSVALEPLPGFFDYDVDARFDAVWVVGFDGIAIKTQAAWCHVLVTPRI